MALKNVDKQLTSDMPLQLEGSETDDPITIKEIKFVLNKLKNGKAGGPDGIINEVIKYSCNITLKSVAKLFNLILKSGHYPKQWNKSYMILLMFFSRL
jgi:hypothetical protein